MVTPTWYGMEHPPMSRHHRLTDTTPHHSQ
jgi:hypothetical protein